MPEIGIKHEVIGPGGVVQLDVMDNWSAEEAAPGGYMAAAGTITKAQWHEGRDIFTFGARYRAYIQGPGQGGGQRELFAGRLMDPAPMGGPKGDGPVQLSVRGHGTLADRSAGRKLFQSRYVPDWAPRASGPFGPTGEGYVTPGEQKFNVSNDGGSLEWSLTVGTTFEGGEAAGFVLWPVANQPSEIHFKTHTRSPTGQNPHFKIRLNIATGPGGNLQPDYPGVGFDVVDGGEITYQPTKSGDLAALSLYRLTNGEGGSNPYTLGYEELIWLDKLYINGQGIRGATAYGSEIVRSLCAEMGVHPLRIEEDGNNVLPLDLKEGSYAEILDRVALLSDWRWLILSTEQGPIMDYGPWDSRRWRVIDFRTPHDLVPLERYNEVVVPFLYSNGTAQGEMRVRANPDPFPDYTNTFSDLSLPGPVPDALMAEVIGHRVANYLAKLRLMGQAELFEVMDTATQQMMSGQMVRAGDTLILPNNSEVRITKLTRKPLAPIASFDGGLPAMYHAMALRSRRFAARGLIG